MTTEIEQLDRGTALQTIDTTQPERARPQLWIPFAAFALVFLFGGIAFLAMGGLQQWGATDDGSSQPAAMSSAQQQTAQPPQAQPQQQAAPVTQQDGAATTGTAPAQR